MRPFFLFMFWYGVIGPIVTIQVFGNNAPKIPIFSIVPLGPFDFAHGREPVERLVDWKIKLNLNNLRLEVRYKT